MPRWHPITDRSNKTLLWQFRCQNVIDQADALAGVKLSMGHQPDRNWNGDLIGKYWLDCIGIGFNILGQNADAKSLTNQFVKDMPARRIELKLLGFEIDLWL